jgi:uncharacterized protein (TIGR02231 family)
MRLILSLALLLPPAALFAQDAAEVGGRPAANKIVAVTVYQGNALVTREVTVPEGAGTMELIVAPLPAETVPNSLYAEGIDGLRILNTRFRSRAIKEDVREEVRKLDAQLKQLHLLGQRMQADVKTAEQNQEFLNKLETFTGATMQHLAEKGLLNSDSTIGLAKYIMMTRTERAKEIVAILQQIEANNEQVEFTKRQLGELAGGTQRVERDAVIVVDKANAAGGKVRLNYLVGKVHWRPQYKLRAGKDKDPVALEYLASVIQQTGEDWTGVAIALSTAQPMLNAAPPDLKSLEVTSVPFGTPNAQPGQQAAGPQGKAGYKDLVKRAVAGRQQSQQLSNTYNWMEASKVVNEAAALEQYGDLLCAKEDILAVHREGDTNDGPCVTFHLKPRLTLPSRNDEQTLEIARIELTPDFYYKAVPVLSSNVYRQATLANRSDYILLPGEATMYLGSDFVGRGELPLVAIGKQFTVGFGVDPQLQVSRQLVNKDRKLTGGNQVLTFEYRILVNSYKTEPVKLQVWDRLPKAEAQTMAISLINQKPELSSDPMYQREERTKNLLRWDVTVQPTQNGEKALAVDYQFRLELDKNLQIGAVAAK